MIGHDRTIPCWILLGWSWGLKSWRRRMAAGSGIPLLLEPLLEEPHVTHLPSVAGGRRMSQVNVAIKLPISEDTWWSKHIKTAYKCKSYKTPLRNAFHSIYDCFRPTNFREQLSLPPLDHGPIPHRPTFSIWRSSKKVLRDSVAVNCGKNWGMVFSCRTNITMIDSVPAWKKYGMHNTIVIQLYTDWKRDVNLDSLMML